MQVPSAAQMRAREVEEGKRERERGKEGERGKKYTCRNKALYAVY